MKRGVLFGRGKAKSANTLETYTAAVAFMRKKHFNKGVLSDVMAGVKKTKTGDTRIKKTVTLPMMCDLTVHLSSPKAGNFGLMRAVIYNQLGQGLLRSIADPCQLWLRRSHNGIRGFT